MDRKQNSGHRGVQEQRRASGQPRPGAVPKDDFCWPLCLRFLRTFPPLLSVIQPSLLKLLHGFPSLPTKGFFCPRKDELLSRVRLSWALTLLTAGSSQGEPPPGQQLAPGLCPGTRAAAGGLPLCPGSHVQKSPSEAGLGPSCPLGWQGTEPVGSALTWEPRASSPMLTFTAPNPAASCACRSSLVQKLWRRQWS